LTKSDDAMLLERWRTARDGDAFAELARRHVPVVFDLAARTLGDRTAAEDIVQEALLDLALEPTARPAEVGVVAWLARFAICRARNKRSSERSRARRQQVVGLRRPEDAMPDDELERKEELEHALAAAQPEERAVLAMRFLHGWEYDRIASALSTTEGAARVRVHRALSNVRSRLGVGRENETVASGLAALAFVPMSPSWMSSAITTAIGGATVPVNPAPLPGLTSVLRASMLGVGAALVIGAAVVLAPSAFDAAGSGSSASATIEFASADAAGTARGGAAAMGAGASAVAGGPTAGARPEDWDDGALARLARSGSSSPSTETPAPEAPADAAPPQAPVPPAEVPADQQTSGAFRPDQRGASAANCDSGPSDDGRADAPGAFVRPAAVEVIERPATDDREDAPALDPMRLSTSQAAARAATVGRAFEELDASERALVEEAAALVREALAKAGGTAAVGSGDESRVRRDGERSVRRQVREYRRQAGRGEQRLAGRRGAKLSRLVSVLIDFALTSGGDAGAIRWPDGVDVATAMAELIRVLEAGSGGEVRAPDIASEPSTDRLPELE
jgi:RNA polymerase sigma-70 factor (ECF subfamily)